MLGRSNDDIKNLGSLLLILCIKNHKASKNVFFIRANIVCNSLRGFELKHSGLMLGKSNDDIKIVGSLSLRNRDLKVSALHFDSQQEATHPSLFYLCPLLEPLFV